VQRLLQHLPARLDQLDLALDLVRDRALHEAERVQVLQLRARAELGLALAPHRDVGVAAELALLHVGVRHLQMAQHLAQAAEVGAGFFGRADLRLGDDLDQRSAGPVQVHVSHSAAGDRIVVDVLRRVLFHVDAGEADRARCAAVFEGHGAAFRERLVVL